MRTKRINTDLYDSLELKNSSDGSLLDLSDAYDMHLYLKKEFSSIALEQQFTITDNKIYYQYNSNENNTLGTYDLHFYYKKNNGNSEISYDQYHFDISGIFQIVKSSEEENWAGGITGVISQYGADGLSAYQIAVKDGFAGTEAEWLESLKLHFQDLTQADITLLQKPAADKAAELENAVSDTAEFLRLADLAEEERGTNESERVNNENARGQAETGREQAETLRVSEEDARKQSEASRVASETERVVAEASRVAAESGRATAESARETSFSESKAAADTATEAANDAAVKFEAAIVQVVGTNTDKVISQNALTVLLNAITDNANLQGNVIAEAIVLLINEVNGLKSMLSQGLGDIRVTSITSDNIPQYRGQSTIVTGSGSPVTNAVLPAFEGQIYIDTTNRNVYMCSDSSSATYWKQLN